MHSMSVLSNYSVSSSISMGGNTSESIRVSIIEGSLYPFARDRVLLMVLSPVINIMYLTKHKHRIPKYLEHNVLIQSLKL